jgi:hypothetical protein
MARPVPEFIDPVFAKNGPINYGTDREVAVIAVVAGGKLEAVSNDINEAWSSLPFIVPLL